MRLTLKAVSVFVIISFMFTSVCSDIAYTFNVGTAESLPSNLAIPSMCSSLMGISAKDIGRIKLSIQAKLRTLLTEAEALKGLDHGDLRKVLKKKYSKIESSIDLDGLQLFLREFVPVEEGVRVKCRAKGDGYGERTYYVVFSLETDEDGNFPIKGIYTEQDYEEHEGLEKELPERRLEDEQAVTRFMIQEAGIDKVLEYAHENGLAKKPMKEVFDYKKTVQELIERLNLNVTTPQEPVFLVPMEERDFFVVKLTDEIKKRLDLSPVRLVDESGEETEITCYAHSSNGSVHIFVDEEIFTVLTTKQGGFAPIKSRIKDVLLKKVAHEMGAMVGMPLSFESVHIGEAMVWNEMDERFLDAYHYDNTTIDVKRNPLDVTVVDLSTNLLTRDYASQEPPKRFTRESLDHAVRVFNTLIAEYGGTTRERTKIREFVENNISFALETAASSTSISGEELSESVAGMQLAGGQLLTIISWIDRKVPGARGLRLTSDPEEMVTSPKGLSYIDRRTIPHNVGETKEEGRCGFFWRGIEKVKKLAKGVLEVLKMRPKAIDENIVMYLMNHGFIQAPKGIVEATEKGRISTIHETFFINDTLRSSIQTTSTGSGHYQGTKLDIKYVTEGKGIQFNVKYGDNGEILEVLAQHLRKGYPCMALPGYVDYMVNLGGLRFNDVSVDLTFEELSSFYPNLDEAGYNAIRTRSVKPDNAPYLGVSTYLLVGLVKNMEGAPGCQWFDEVGMTLFATESLIERYKGLQGEEDIVFLVKEAAENYIFARKNPPVIHMETYESTDSQVLKAVQEAAGRLGLASSAQKEENEAEVEVGGKIAIDPDIENHVKVTIAAILGELKSQGDDFDELIGRTTSLDILKRVKRAVSSVLSKDKSTALRVAGIAIFPKSLPKLESVMARLNDRIEELEAESFFKENAEKITEAIDETATEEAKGSDEPSETSKDKKQPRNKDGKWKQKPGMSPPEAWEVICDSIAIQKALHEKGHFTRIDYAQGFAEVRPGEDVPSRTTIEGTDLRAWVAAENEEERYLKKHDEKDKDGHNKYSLTAVGHAKRREEQLEKVREAASNLKKGVEASRSLKRIKGIGRNPKVYFSDTEGMRVLAIAYFVLWRESVNGNKDLFKGGLKQLAKFIDLDENLYEDIDEVAVREIMGEEKPEEVQPEEAAPEVPEKTAAVLKKLYRLRLWAEKVRYGSATLREFTEWLDAIEDLEALEEFEGELLRSKDGKHMFYSSRFGDMDLSGKIGAAIIAAKKRLEKKKKLSGIQKEKPNGQKSAIVKKKEPQKAPPAEAVKFMTASEIALLADLVGEDLPLEEFEKILLKVNNDAVIEELADMLVVKGDLSVQKERGWWVGLLGKFEINAEIAKRICSRADEIRIQNARSVVEKFKAGDNLDEQINKLVQITTKYSTKSENPAELTMLGIAHATLLMETSHDPREHYESLGPVFSQYAMVTGEDTQREADEALAWMGEKTRSLEDIPLEKRTEDHEGLEYVAERYKKELSTTNDRKKMIKALIEMTRDDDATLLAKTIAHILLLENTDHETKEHSDFVMSVSLNSTLDSRAQALAIEAMERRRDPVYKKLKRDSGGKFIEHPGKNTEDAKKVIAISLRTNGAIKKAIDKNGYFTIKDYKEAYEEVLEKLKDGESFPGLKLEELADDPWSTIRRDLYYPKKNSTGRWGGLVREGFLRVANRYASEARYDKKKKRTVGPFKEVHLKITKKGYEQMKSIRKRLLTPAGDTPEGTWNVIVKAPSVERALLEKGYFTLKDLKEGYHQMRKKAGFQDIPSDRKLRENLEKMWGALVRVQQPGDFKIKETPYQLTPDGVKEFSATELDVEKLNLKTFRVSVKRENLYEAFRTRMGFTVIRTRDGRIFFFDKKKKLVGKTKVEPLDGYDDKPYIRFSMDGRCILLEDYSNFTPVRIHDLARSGKKILLANAKNITNRRSCYEDGFSPNGRYFAVAYRTGLVPSEKHKYKLFPGFYEYDYVVAVYDLHSEKPEKPIIDYRRKIGLLRPVDFREKEYEMSWSNVDFNYDSSQVTMKFWQGSSEVFELGGKPKKEEVRDMIALADRAGRVELPTSPNKRYTLLMTSEFFGDDRKEMEKQAFEYGDRFNLGMVSGRSEEDFIDNVFLHIDRIEEEKNLKDVAKRTIVLVPYNISEEQLNRLAWEGIRFLRVRPEALKMAREERTTKENRAFQENIYAAMLLARHVKSNTDKNSASYRLLKFYLKSFFQLDAVPVEDYIRAIITGDIAVLVQGILRDRPATPYDAEKDYNEISHALIFA